MSAKKVYFLFAERRQSFAKIVQVSAKKTCFQFAERRQSYAKIAFLNDTSKSMRLDFRFRRVSVCQRAIRLREAFIFYPLPTEDSLWFLHIGKGQTFQEMTFAMRGNAKPFGKRLSPCAEMPNHSGNDFRHARKCQTLRETTFAKRGNAKPFGKRLSPSAEMPNLSGNDFRHARKRQTFREMTFARRGNAKPFTE